MTRLTSPRSRRLALTAVAAATALVLVACGEDDPDGSADDPGDDPSSSSAEPTESSSPAEPTPSATETGGGATTTVPVYFVGDGPDGRPRLFREFREVTGDPLVEAAALLTAGDALDPDYRTLFPSGAAIEGVSFDGSGADGVIQVTLADDGLARRPAGMSAAEARVAVQSLVYTLQGVVQARAPLTAYVGDTPSPLLGIDTGDGVTAAPQLTVLNLVNVTAPQEGAEVSGSFTASGVASSFEATVPWEVRRGDQVVLEGFSTAAGWMNRLHPWETEVDVSGLEPGEYSFVALTDDPSGGAEGPGASEDSKTIIVG